MLSMQARGPEIGFPNLHKAGLIRPTYNGGSSTLRSEQRQEDPWKLAGQLACKCSATQQKTLLKLDRKRVHTQNVVLCPLDVYSVMLRSSLTQVRTHAKIKIKVKKLLHVDF